MAETGKNKEVLDNVLNCFYASRDDNYRQYKEEAWLRCYNNYRSKLETIIPRRSNLFIPETFKTIETMVAREKSAIWGAGTLFKFSARRERDIQAADTVSEFAKYDISRIPNVYRKLEDFLRILHVYGTSIFRVFWDYDHVEEIVNGRTQINVTRDQFNIDTVSPRNFYPDPIAKRLDQCSYIVTRSMIDMEDFKIMVDRLEYIKMKKEEIEKLGQEYYFMDGERSSLEAILFNNMTSMSQNPDRKFVEILEFWDLKNDRFVVIAGREKIVRNTPIPFKHKRFPFVVGVDTPDPEHFWGISTAEVISDLNVELNAIRNNRMDKYNYIANPMWKVRQGSLFDRKELASRQGGIVRLKDVDDLQPLFVKGMEQSDYIEENNVKADIQTTSSISDYSMGTGSKNMNETATGISIISSNADSRIIGKVEYLEEEVLKQLGHFWLSMQQQFMKAEEIFYVTGQEYALTRDMVFKNYLLEVVASTKIANRQVRQNNVVQLAQLVTNNPLIDQREWLKFVFETFGMSPGKMINPALPPMALPSPESMQPPMGGQMPGETVPNQLGTSTGFDYAKGQPTG